MMHTFQFYCTKTPGKRYEFNGQAPYTNFFACILVWSCFVNSKKVELKYNYLLGRHAAPGKDISRGLNGKGHSDLSVTKTEFCDKFEKICDNSD